MKTEWYRLALTALLAAALMFAGPVACGDDDDPEGEETPSESTEGPGGTTTTPVEPGVTATTPVEPGETTPVTTPVEPLGSIIDVATADGNFTILLQALETAELTTTLENLDQDFTVFAPTDDVFNAFIDGNDDIADAAALLALDNLGDILLYHVLVGSAVLAADVAPGPATTGSNFSAWLATEGGVSINGASVDTADVLADNGVIHVIDSVLLPPTIADFAGFTGVHDNLVAALVAADLVGAVTDPDSQVTVFAPTDAAFAAAVEALETTLDDLLADTGTLETILTYHVFAGLLDSAAVVAEDGNDIEMFSGEEAAVDATALTLEGAALNGDLLDIVTTTGTIHVLNDVMIPRSLQPDDALGSIIDVATANGNFTTLLQALAEVDLTDVLADLDEDFTVFAPTDAAFDALIAENPSIEDVAELLALDNLAEILLYHVIGGATIEADDVTTGPATMEAGLSTWLVSDESGVTINGATVGPADVFADNGVIHVIDSVLLPLDIPGFASLTGVHGNLVTALETAELVAAVSDTGSPVTVFAPTDDAFAAAIAALDAYPTLADLLADVPTLTTILTYHVFGGELDSAGVLAEDGQDIEMLSEELAAVVADPLSIEGAEINGALVDIFTTSGIIHVLNGVMVPRSIAGAGDE